MLHLKNYWLGKRGAVGDQATLPMFLFLLLIIAVAIVIGNLMFFGKEYDSRVEDAQALNYKISECMAQEELGNLFSSEEVFFDKCGLNKTSFSSGKLAFKICSASEANCELTNTKGVFKVGSNFEVCDFKGAKSNEGFQRCFQSSFSKSGSAYTILSWSNQKIEKESVK